MTLADLQAQVERQREDIESQRRLITDLQGDIEESRRATEELRNRPQPTLNGELVSVQERVDALDETIRQQAEGLQQGRRQTDEVVGLLRQRVDEMAGRPLPDDPRHELDRISDALRSWELRLDRVEDRFPKNSRVNVKEGHVHPGGGAEGAPIDATYLVTTANADLSAEIVVGATPGGELGGTWDTPTVDPSHSGSTHAATQAAAEATADAALSTHAGAADPHTGYRLESADHSHASAGAQAGQLVPASIFSGTDITVAEMETLTDGSTTALHAHSGLATDSLQDADADTKVEVERTADDDTIYLRSQGADLLTLNYDGTYKQAFLEAVLRADYQSYTISGGVLTVHRSAVLVTGEGGAADTLNNLATHNADLNGAIVILRATPGDTITIAHESGGLAALRFHMIDGQDFVLADNNVIAFQYGSFDVASRWHELFRLENEVFELGIQAVAFGQTATTGDDKYNFRIPTKLGGMDLVGIKAAHDGAGSSGGTTINIRNNGGTDVLSTALTIDSGELSSATAATPAVINTAQDGVAADDLYHIDIDGWDTGATGLLLWFQFQFPVP